MGARQKRDTYDNPFYKDNVYGHTLALLRRHQSEVCGKLHLDIGCGFGRIAEPLREQLGVDYVGCDADPAGLASLALRGFETHEVRLGDEQSSYSELSRLLAGRPLASLSMLDTLEHLIEPEPVLRALRRITSEHGAFLVLSTPNVAHRDIGFRLAFGQWDYTEAGLLDHTHRVLFNNESLQRLLARCGLHVVDANDVQIVRSDQAFPSDHPVLARGTSLNRLLTNLRDGVDAFAETNQFVRLCLPGPAEANSKYVEERDPPRPFLSIVTRTQGTRLHALAEVFTCLAGQTDIDFEVLVVGHRLDYPTQLRVERLIDDNPQWLRDKIRLVRVDSGNRTRPLNEGFEAAQGQYIVVLDDDDTPFANWVETFERLARNSPGRLLRAVAVRQEVRNVEILGRSAIRAEGPPDKQYPSSFDLLEHLRVNQSPPVSIAFPRGVFHRLNIKFDESLTTTEDWDYILRVAGVVGTDSAPDITSIYRWWTVDDSSRTQHRKEEWDQNHTRILIKLDSSQTVLFPPGTTGRIRFLLDALDRANRDRAEIECASFSDSKKFEALREVLDIYMSTSWRITAPVRFVGRLLGRPKSDPRIAWHLSPDGLLRLAHDMRASTSWRVSAPIRALRFR
jgi:glycosyltransferase involved in cell wall biosynthesis/2-polyprenyl-3-methyl-5-hydroxy-6-metoxy-1,4-benzoquinol methylase